MGKLCQEMRHETLGQERVQAGLRVWKPAGSAGNSCVLEWIYTVPMPDLSFSLRVPLDFFEESTPPPPPPPPPSPTRARHNVETVLLRKEVLYENKPFYCLLF